MKKEEHNTYKQGFFGVGILFYLTRANQFLPIYFLLCYDKIPRNGDFFGFE
ncbi:hypothetical protein [uncultured Croceitalea sp.]|uniref:hypothetical protein n=1 Tax=uncultured Croceitalea sp. TaxID=1798908 RepID=UPI0033060025